MHDIAFEKMESTRVQSTQEAMIKNGVVAVTGRPNVKRDKTQRVSRFPNPRLSSTPQ